MKFIRSIILITLMLVFCFQQWVVILVFDLNQQYIAQNLDVHRNNPHNTCQGKCYLGKALQKNTDESTEAKAPIKYKVETFVGKEAALEYEKKFIIIDNPLFAKPQQFHSQSFTTTTFHPPDLFV